MVRSIDRALCRFEDTFITTLLLSSSLILFVNVVARYVFNTGIVWAEELVRYEIIWMVFVGGSVAVRKGIHIGVEVLLKVLPRRAEQALRVTVGLICVAFCLVLLIYSVELAQQTRSFGQRTSAMQMPFWIVQLAIPVGAGLMLIRFSQELWRDVTGQNHRAETEILG